MPIVTPSSPISTIQATAHLGSGDPVISVDTKKKELVGAYKNGGREWQPKGRPDQVKVHDFIDPALGKANPYGVYDVGANTGWVSVGTDHDTAAFAVNTIRTWWQQAGRTLHPDASRLLICADGGGSNGYRTRQWENRTGCTRCRHRLDHHRMPPAAGHQQVEQDRASTVLPHLDELARQTIDQPRSDRRDHRRDDHQHRPDRPRRTRDRAIYPTGVKIPDQQMKDLENNNILTRHEFHGEWNYAFHPKPRHAESN